MDEKKRMGTEGKLSRMLRISEGRLSRPSPRDALAGTVSALATFLLAGRALPFATYPMGIALLCASSRYTLPMAAGLLAAAFTLPTPPWLTVAVTALTLLVRIAARVFVDLPTRIGGDGRRGEFREHLRGRLFCEGLYLRMACACVSVFFLSLFAIVRGGFRYYDLFGAIFSMVAAPILVFLFAGLFADEYPRLFGARVASVMEGVSEVTLLAAVCYSLSDAILSGIPLSLVFAFVSVLSLCRRRGFFVGLLGAVAVGFTMGPTHPLILLAAVLAAFCIFDASPMLAAMVACIAGTVVGVLAPGGGSVSTVFLPLFSGAAVYCTALKLMRGQSVAQGVVPPSDGSKALAEQIEVERERTERVAVALDELSGVFEAMSRRQKRPSGVAYQRMCESCFEQLCTECGAREACHEKRYGEVRAAMEALAARLCEEGRVSEETLPEAVCAGCLCVGEAVKRINEGAAELTRAALRSEKAELFSMDYGASARLLRELSVRGASDLDGDSKTAEAIRARFAELGYTACVEVTGTRRKRLTVRAVSPEINSDKAAYLVRQTEGIVGFPWALPTVTEDGFFAERTARIRADVGSSLAAKEGVCGDVISIFGNEGDGYLYALLDDGMGTGEEAALTAQLGSLFLRKLLPVGVCAETALGMLNQFLRSGRNGEDAESSTTVDLLTLDLLTGRAGFLKSGAAPTYVKRGKNIFYLDSKTAPLGILKEIDAKQVEFEVKEGDLIVMVSDGVTEGENECLWLLDLLDATEETDPERLAAEIVSHAAERADPDDLSAIVLRISKA